METPKSQNYFIESRGSATAEKTPKHEGFFMPAEWEPHEATWLSWPKNELTFPKEVIGGVEQAYCDIVSALSGHETVKLLVDNGEQEERVGKKLEESGAVMKNVELVKIPSADVWARDYAPSFLLSRDRKKLGAVKWEFNAWGAKYDDLLPDNETGIAIADSTGAKVFRPHVVMEGGSIDVNGRGAVLTTEQCLLNKNRNPKLSKEEISQVLKENLNCSEVIWLKEGIEGDDTDGHIDDFCRFTGEKSVLIAQGGEGGNGRALSENGKTLQAACDAKGWELSELPMPKKMIDEEENRVLPASYANFYIANNVVLLPVFKDGKDRLAQEIVESFFAGREVVPIHSRELVFGYGGVHCITQQQPKTSD